MTHPVDVHVGKKIRQRRWMLGMSQQQLADLVGVNFQQIQKYEKATNRISASRMWDVAAALEVPVEFFFTGMDETAEPEEVWGEEVFFEKKEAMKLVRAYYQIPAEQRMRLLDLAQVLGETRQHVH